MKFIDLFSGIGGIRIAFERNDFKCVFSSEIDKYARKTYEANFKEVPYGDITTIDINNIPEFDVLTAGFPCQPFSQAGKGKGFSDARGTLFFEIEKILKYHKPKAFLLENVKRLKGHDNGKTFSIICDSLTNLGYYHNHTVLNAKDFGLPQNRERLYIVGFKDKECLQKFTFPEKLNISTKLGNILEQNVSKYTISDRLWAGHQKRKEKNAENGKGFGYRIFDENSTYVSTLSARYYKDGSEILIKQDNKNPRKLTPREAARLQGFPENFQICDSDNNAYKQFGNSVPINVVYEIAKNIKKALL